MERESVAVRSRDNASACREVFESSDRAAAIFARYAASISFEQIPAGVIDTATMLVEDNIGCALGALSTPAARLFLAVTEMDSATSAALAIGGRATSVSSAVFCNSSLSNWLDFDDMHDFFSPYHLGCLIVPTALAVAQSVGASGQEFLTAVTVAYEVTMRLGRSFGKALLWRLGVPLAPFAELAAAIAAAKLYQLTAEQIRAVFSIVALDEIEFSPRHGKADLPPTRRLGFLKGNFSSFAQIGTWAALKARAGLTGSPGFLESNLSEWCRAGMPEFGFETLTTRLGQEYVTTKMSLKPTPSCRWTHAPITAAWNALGGRTLDATHVERIRIFGVPRLERAQWSSMQDAQFSMPCALALAISGVAPGPGWYAEEIYKSTGISELAAKIIQETDSDSELMEIRDNQMSCRVEIELKDGKTLHGECSAVKGSPENPLTEEERAVKFEANTAHLANKGRDVRAAIRRLALGASVEELSRALEASWS